MKKKHIIIIIIFVIGFFVVRGLFVKPVNQKQELTHTLTKGSIESQINLSGEITASKKATLSFQSGGKLVYLNANEGQKVKKGDLLAKLDTEILNSTYQQALSDLRNEEATLARVYDLLKGKGNSETFSEKETRTDAEISKDKAYEAVLKARKALQDAIIYSPFSGIITNVSDLVSTGIFIQYTDLKIEVTDPSSIYFSATAEQSELYNFKIGQSVKIKLDSLADGSEIEGLIYYIGFTPKPQETETVYELKVKLNNVNNDNLDIKIGMTGDLTLITGKAENVFYAPNRFIKSNNGDKYVISGNDKKKIIIKTGIEGEEGTEIISNELFEGMILHD